MSLGKNYSSEVRKQTLKDEKKKKKKRKLARQLQTQVIYTEIHENRRAQLHDWNHLSYDQPIISY